jgi:hypothetical protein
MNYGKAERIGLIFIVGLCLAVILIAFSGSDFRTNTGSVRATASATVRPASRTAAPATQKPQTDPYALSIPVVGMKESDINMTRHLKIFRKTTESYSNKNHTVYYSDANAVKDIPCTVSLKCVNGIVTEVNDYRDDPLPIVHFRSGNEKSSGSKKKDRYYGDAEEFYYDHIEDFEELDEAEEYYNEHYR